MVKSKVTGKRIAWSSFLGVPVACFLGWESVYVTTF